MGNVGKIRFKKENDKPKLMDSIIFILIIILCVVTMVTVQIRSQQKKETETTNMQRVENDSETTPALSGDMAEPQADDLPTDREKLPQSDITSDFDEAMQLQSAAVSGENTAETEHTATASDETDEPVIQENKLEFSPPVDGKVIKRFSTSDLLYSKTLDDWRMHPGIDIAAPIGTDVLACESGRVEEIYDDEEVGATVTIRHNERLVTRYSNLALSHIVAVGEQVVKGQKIGVVGDTAMYEILDEAHLHFSMSDNGALTDPDIYIKFNYEK